MKKILLLFSICLIPMLGYAQTDENGKERVYIDYFSRPGTSHRNHRKIKEHIFFIINHLYISYFLYFCHILPIFRYSVHF